MRAAVLIAAALWLAAAAGALVGLLATSPRLVGYGCEGASGPLYADEEDIFPRCKDIHAN